MKCLSSVGGSFWGNNMVHTEFAISDLGPF